MNLSERLKKSQTQPKSKKRTAPLWEGPDGNGDQGGITYSLLCRFLNCRERFRIQVVEGLRVRERFSAPMEYGNMWHVCEEHFAAGQGRIWANRLQEHCTELMQRFPLDREEIAHWHSLCQIQFPMYVEHWNRHPDVQKRTPLLQEHVFDVLYKLPSGRTVRLRGKFDSVDLIGNGIWLQENKTKSRIEPEKIKRQLSYDLQTMMYIIALGLYQKNLGIKDGSGFPIATPIKGVRYNVVRRSSHKYADSFQKKLMEDRDAKRMNEWFDRWEVAISAQDIARFKRECFNPILEQLWDWWEWVSKTSPGVWEGRSIHWRHPFGVYNVLDEGGSTDLDYYLETGSTIGLEVSDQLFRELQG